MWVLKLWQRSLRFALSYVLALDSASTEQHVCIATNTRKTFQTFPMSAIRPTFRKRSLTRIHHNHQSLNFSPWYLHLFRGKHKKHFTRTCLSFKTIQLRGKPFNCVKSHSTAWKAIQMRGNLDWKDFNGGKFFVQLCRVIQLWKAVERYKWVIALTDQYWAVKMVK